MLCIIAVVAVATYHHVISLFTHEKGLSQSSGHEMERKRQAYSTSGACPSTRKSPRRNLEKKPYSNVNPSGEMYTVVHTVLYCIKPNKEPWEIVAQCNIHSGSRTITERKPRFRVPWFLDDPGCWVPCCYKSRARRLLRRVCAVPPFLLGPCLDLSFEFLVPVTSPSLQKLQGTHTGG